MGGGDMSMTLDHILKAAVSSMIRGHHSPHCYSAWVKGEGYVNDGSGTVARHDRADYLRQLERAASSEVESMGFAPYYADKRETQPRKAVLMANWNSLPTRLTDLLELAGYAIEWSDEWTTCDACNGAIRTSPTGYFWTPQYKVDENSSMLCLPCYADEHPCEDTSTTED